MKDKKVWKLKDPSKVVSIIDFKYRDLLKRVIKNYLIDFQGNLPIDWEDLYFEFLYELSSSVREFDEKLGVKFEKFITNRCWNFVRNKCKYYTKKEFEVMNNYVPVEDQNFELADNTSEIALWHSFDINDFSTIERRVIKIHFLEGKNAKDTCREAKISFYKFSLIKEAIKTKIELQLKN